MKNVFLIGNGFDLHHMLPTKYYDFMCVAEYLKNNNIKFPLSIGDVFSKCKDNKNIEQCYAAHEEVFNAIEIDREKVVELSNIIDSNIWFEYFSKTLNRDLGWIDFEKEIFMIINTLNDIIDDDSNTVFLPERDLLQPFVLSNFRFFIDIYEDAEINPMDDFDIKEEYLKEYPYNSGIFVADKKRIFEELYNKLYAFSKALNIYFDCFVESLFSMLPRDEYIRKCRINLLKLADIAISFNYTRTLEKVYLNENTYHVHGTIDKENIVLGVNADEIDGVGTNNTALIKFKKYYQREIYGTDIEYINWYRETISAKKKYRVIVIGHSLDMTDKDILSTIFQKADKIYIAYYDDERKHDYISNIITIFGESGYDKLKKENNMEFILLSKIDELEEILQQDRDGWFF